MEVVRGGPSGALESLNAFVAERLTAAAAEIVAAVEETLTGYRREMSRSRREVEQLRSLLLRRPGAASARCRDVSPERCHQDHQATRRLAEEPGRRTRDVRRVKAEPGGGEVLTPPEVHSLRSKDQLEVTDEEDWSDEQQDWSPRQDQEDPEGPQVKVAKLTRSSTQEESEHEVLQPGTSAYDEARSSSPGRDQTLCTQTCDEGEEKGGGAEAGGPQLSSYWVNPSCPAPQSERGVNGEPIAAHKPKGTRKKKRKNSNLGREGGENIRTDDDVSDLTAEGGDACLLWPQRVKESGQVEDHVRVHTDMLQVLLQKVDSVESNVNKLLNCVTRVRRPSGEDADVDLRTAKSLHELEQLEERLKDVHFRQRVTHHLGLVGGFTPGECVRRVMRTLASSTVWSNYSLYGKKSKRPLIESTVCTVIKQAVMRSKSGLAEKDAEKLIAETLKHSPAMAKKDVQRNQETRCPELLLVKEEDDQICIF